MLEEEIEALQTISILAASTYGLPFPPDRQSQKCHATVGLRRVTRRIAVVERSTEMNGLILFTGSKG